MTTARFKDLCIDTRHPGVAAPFWSAALGLRAEGDGAPAVLRDEVAEHTIWLNTVPEPKIGKNRVHLDLHTGSIEELVDLGATVVATLPRWTVLADPEGNELCAFIRDVDDLPRYRLYELSVDAAQPERIATWWAERWNLQAHADPDGFWWLDPGAGLPWEMVFAPVPEPKTAKNRVHWDVWGDPDDFLDAGATLLRAKDDEIGWHVLADPEGNEFCVFAPPRAS
ncbi:VOC family protein [Microlunatus panaciterrae]|uniref:Glyoxalase-like domain-containing protein n=1 Tax=Microlunatus panaciterrae TaxID=400768 RepID=A0ABS2RGV6_9ACTN|nr:VOC family protein [Microlunatus panaciterrae]MBM7797913.1 hypothetical protein [Microlunatus panaciterrae]